MGSKKIDPGKGITAFDEEVETTPSSNNEVRSNVNVINSSTFNVNEDPLKKLQQEKPAKALTTKLHGVYFDLDVSKAIDEVAKTISKGGKSRLINDVMKKYLYEQGYLR